MSEHINPITGRDMRSFAERKAARIAAGPQQFVFKVTAHGGFPTIQETEFPREFTSRREALDFAYETLSSSSDSTRANKALSAMGIITMNPRFDVWRVNKTTGERSSVSHMEFWK